MSASVDDRKKYAETVRAYLIISVLCAVYGMIYELFGHKVYSLYMIFAFVIPLLGGFVPSIIMYALKVKRCRAAADGLYRSGIAALTVGSIIKGVLEIYGTTNALSRLYLYVGAALTILGIVLFLWDKLQCFRRKIKKERLS